MVSNASEDLPDPETPVTTVSALCGISRSIFFRLWTRAPLTTISSFAMSPRIQQAFPERLPTPQTGSESAAETSYYNLVQRTLQERWGPLPRKIEQPKYVDPKHSHEVPIPCGNVDDDAARFRWAQQPGGQSRIQERQYSAHEMNRMHSGEDEKKRTADVCLDVDMAEGQAMPGEILPSEKHHTKDDGR